MRTDNVSGIIRKIMSVTELKTQSALADFIGVSRNAISKAKARGEIPDRWIVKISEITMLPVSELITEKIKKEIPMEKRIQIMVNTLKETSDQTREGLDMETARSMLLNAESLAAALQGWLFKRIAGDGGQ